MKIAIQLMLSGGRIRTLHEYNEGEILLPRIDDIVDLNYPWTDREKHLKEDNGIKGTVKAVIHFPNLQPPEIWVYIKQR